MVFFALRVADLNAKAAKITLSLQGMKNPSERKNTQKRTYR